VAPPAAPFETEGDNFGESARVLNLHGAVAMSCDAMGLEGAVEPPSRIAAQQLEHQQLLALANI
jgi:hypothetical protein